MQRSQKLTLSKGNNNTLLKTVIQPTFIDQNAINLEINKQGAKKKSILLDYKNTLLKISWFKKEISCLELDHSEKGHIKTNGIWPKQFSEENASPTFTY